MFYYDPIFKLQLKITVTFSYSICFILFQHVLFPVFIWYKTHVLWNVMESIKHNGAYLFPNQMFQQLHHISKENHPKGITSYNFIGISPKRRIQPSTTNVHEYAQSYIGSYYTFFAWFQFVLSNFFLFINISTTSSCSLYFPVNIFLLFLQIFFVLLLSALHFSLLFFMFWMFFLFCLPPHRKEISYFGICWNKQL